MQSNAQSRRRSNQRYKISPLFASELRASVLMRLGGIWHRLVDRRELEYKHEAKEVKIMLWTIVGVLAVLWLLGVVTSYTMGGLIHILLVIAVLVFLVNLISGRRTI